MDNQFIAMMNELQVSLMTDEDLTVIPADTFHSKHKDDIAEIQAEVRDNESSNHLAGMEERALGEVSTPLKPRPMERPLTPPGDVSRSFFCSGSDVFDTVMPMSSMSRGPPALPNSDSPSIMETFSQPQRSDSAEQTPTRLFQSATHPSPSALKAGARAWREMHGRPANANFGIDFRTGLSGHMALLSTSAHPHEYLEPGNQRGSNFRGMSNHTGLTMWKPARRQLPRQTNNLSMPSFGGSPQREDSSTLDSMTPTP